MEKEKVERINALYRKSQTPEGLTPEEKEEQAALRAAYLAEIRTSFGSTLEHTVAQKPDGTKVPLKDWNNGKTR